MGILETIEGLFGRRDKGMVDQEPNSTQTPPMPTSTPTQLPSEAPPAAKPTNIPTNPPPGPPTSGK